MQPELLDEWSQPSATIGIIHELVEVLEVQCRLKQFRTPGFEPGLVEFPQDIRNPAWRQQLRSVQFPSTEQKSDQPRVCLALQRWIRAARRSHEGPVTARF